MFELFYSFENIGMINRHLNDFKLLDRKIINKCGDSFSWNFPGENLALNFVLVN